MNRTLFNFVAFQVGWFSCVLGAANGLPLLGVLVVCLIVALQAAALFRTTGRLPNQASLTPVQLLQWDKGGLTHMIKATCCKDQNGHYQGPDKGQHDHT